MRRSPSDAIRPIEQNIWNVLTDASGKTVREAEHVLNILVEGRVQQLDGLVESRNAHRVGCTRNKWRVRLRAKGNGAYLRALSYVELSLIHISEPTRLGMISYAVFCLK